MPLSQVSQAKNNSVSIYNARLSKTMPSFSSCLLPRSINLYHISPKSILLALFFVLGTSFTAVQAKSTVVIDKNIIDMAMTSTEVVESEIDDGANEVDSGLDLGDESRDAELMDDVGNSSLLRDTDSAVVDDIAQVPLNAISPETLKTFVQSIDLVRREYIEPVNDETLFNDAISGMLQKLDSHAEFLDATAYNNLRAFTDGDVGSVGIKAKFDDKSGYWVIDEIQKNSPAVDAQIKVGDYLHQIQDIKLTSAMQPLDIEQLLSGIAGSQVTVVVSKAGRNKKTFTLQRNVSKTQPVSIELQEKIAIIRLPAFQNSTAQQLTTALQQLPTAINGVVLDLRNNPGGVLESAVSIASLFMEDTKVVKVQGRYGDPKVLQTSGRPILKDMPLVVLQNRYSASAAEVLASSLQASGRATIVGERSYGKGSVQSVLPLNDEQAIKLTVAHYLTADDKKIDGVGVIPDIELTENDVELWKRQAVTILLAKDRPLSIRFNTPEGGLPASDDY